MDYKLLGEFSNKLPLTLPHHLIYKDCARMGFDVLFLNVQGWFAGTRSVCVEAEVLLNNE